MVMVGKGDLVIDKKALLLSPRLLGICSPFGFFLRMRLDPEGNSGLTHRIIQAR